MVYIERTLITQIDSRDASVLYSTDMRATLKAELAKMYVGKCFKRCYITDVLDIDEHSPPVLEDMRVGGSARIAVKFRVRGIVYDRFEVIPDAKIVEIIEDGKMLLRSRYAAIILAADPRLQQFRVGMTVPVRAVDCRYLPYRDTISVSGIPFVPIKDAAVAIDVSITAADIDECRPLLDRLEAAQKRFQSVEHAKEWMALLDGPSPKDATEFDKVAGRGRISRPDWMPLMNMSVTWTAIQDDKIIKNSVTVLRGYIYAAIKQLELAEALAEQYKWTTEKNSHWITLYRDAK